MLEFSYRLTGRPIGLGLTRPLGELHFLLGWPAFVAAALALSIAHRWLRVRQLPLAIRMTLTAAAPAALTMLLLVRPLQDVSGAGDRETMMLIVSSTALIRWAIFGFVVEMLPLQLVQPRAARDPIA